MNSFLINTKRELRIAFLKFKWSGIYVYRVLREIAMKSRGGMMFTMASQEIWQHSSLNSSAKMHNKLYDLKKELSRQIFEDATWLFFSVFELNDRGQIRVKKWMVKCTNCQGLKSSKLKLYHVANISRWQIILKLRSSFQARFQSKVDWQDSGLWP